ncbi:hypothetical protein GCM10011349_07330 [Novosphingobium indicum]|uniref:Uncharacterized protein n=1 Tax=Novosphingobium indicum TaxID=462949 RepID=A0ABQ2JD83_9SPHN|nr:hypothetical protein GCM10011349_07330 [Novosphingobium indicum]
MGPTEFVRACRNERDALLEAFTDPAGQTEVSSRLLEANLTQIQRELVVAAIGVALTDTIYTLLLALDGAASLDGDQRSFTVTDESGTVISNGDGRLEAAAWDAFHSV